MLFLAGAAVYSTMRAGSRGAATEAPDAADELALDPVAAPRVN